MPRLDRIALLLLALAPTAAHAEGLVQFTCNMASVQQTAFSVLVSCTNHFDYLDKLAQPPRTLHIDFFAPDPRFLYKKTGVTSDYSKSQVLDAFRSIAIEAWRGNRTLSVSFRPGSKPGQLYDCWDENCRLSASWSLVP